MLYPAYGPKPIKTGWKSKKQVHKSLRVMPMEIHMTKKFLLLLCLSLWAGLSPAAVVKYVVNGQLEHMTDRDEYYRTDLYNLDGAYYTREMIVETSISADQFYSGETTQWSNAPGFLVSNVYHITGRPNAATDLHINTSNLSYILSVQNAYGDNRYYDAVFLGSNRLVGELANLFASDEHIYFFGNYIPGNSGYVIEPPFPFENKDVEFLVANVWNYTGTINGKYLQYKQSLFSAHASIVPAPAAAWLFCGGLISLISIARRRTSQLDI